MEMNEAWGRGNLDPMTPAAPRKVRFRDMASWVADSCRLVIRKPLYWVPVEFALLAISISVTFVPIAGNYLRIFVAALFGAFTLALAQTQSEERISLRRAFGLVAAALPSLLWLSAFQVAIFALVDLPVTRLVATDAEFRIFALSEVGDVPLRPMVDLIHSTVFALAVSVVQFAIPLALFSGSSAASALRTSVVAFALSFPVYVAFMVLSVIVPHAITSMLGLPGSALYVALMVLLTPAPYFTYRSAFAQR